MRTFRAMPELPDDLITEILLRLTVETLLRCKLVCKKWFSIISSTCFVYNHCHQQRNLSYPLVFHVKQLNYHGHIDEAHLIQSISLFPDQMVERPPMKLDMGIFPSAVSAICGPCNGIICVFLRNCKLALWNPATRRLWSLPADFQIPSDSRKFSFWIDPLTNEFKIFFIKKGSVNDPRTTPKHGFVMYTSCDDSWRSFEREEALLYSVDDVPIDQCYLYTVSNGFYYFMKINGMTSDYAIIAFDIVNHLFEEIQMPTKIDSRRRTTFLDLYDDGSLTLFSSSKEIFTPHVEQYVEIWLMKEKGCWTKLFSVVDLCSIEVPLGFWKQNELFMMQVTDPEGNSHLFIYDTVSGLSQYLEVTNAYFFPLRYKESLVSVVI